MAKFEPQIITTDSLLKPELIFFGSGYVSRKSLEAVSSRFAIEAVISKSGAGAHDSQSTTQTEEFADERGLDHFTANSADELQELFSTHHFRSQLGLVVDYGVIIPESVIGFFPLGIANSHFSLLPKYRGADPIRAAIINRDKVTGVSVIKITPRLDDGPLIGQTKLELDFTETTKDLTAALLQLQYDWLPQVLVDYSNGAIEPKPQDHDTATHTSKVSKADGAINWAEPAETIEAKIRAYAQWPKSRTELFDKQMIVIEGEVTESTSIDTPGTTHINTNELSVDTSTTQLLIKKLQLPGKAPVSAADFINGYLGSR